ncbi:RNA polymerase sigma factor [Rhizosphaericola mali]|uniref:RNA polymerase sigma factor n=1 Tax=Rhizosphaericola mali TaxID=2545455 RepID=A0A5P2G6H1_9BACT|nr:RNA polymerase sigma factor [Rhizosphaericola mali]
MPLSTKYSENELVLLLQNKDEKGYSYLYDNYSGALYSVVRQMISPEESAADALQESFLKIWKNIHLYDPNKSKLFTWMLHITRNYCIDIIRSKDYKNEKQNQHLENDVFNDVRDATSLSVDHIGIIKVLQQLKEEYKTIINLAYLKGYTHEEISKELNLPLGTIKTRIRNAMIELRTILKA